MCSIDLRVTTEELLKNIFGKKNNILMLYYSKITNLKMASITYISIGSCPHALKLEDLNECSDQMIPTFLRGHISKGDFVDAILIDPMFSQDDRSKILISYFERLEKELNTTIEFVVTKTFNPITGNFTRCYIFLSNIFHVQVFCDYFDENNISMLQSSINKILKIPHSKIVIQQFSGADSVTLSKSLFDGAKNKNKFFDRVLVDMTYGNSSCSTDMSKTFPIYNNEGNFFNFLLYSEDFLSKLDFQSLSISAKNLVIEHFKKSFKIKLNRRHVDYRRISRNETCLFEENLHLDSTQIFDLLKKNLFTIVGLLQKLEFFDEVKTQKLLMLFKNHTEYDVYKWYSEVNSLV